MAIAKAGGAAASGEAAAGAAAGEAAETAAVKEGSFSILDRMGYPESVPRPSGPFRVGGARACSGHKSAPRVVFVPTTRGTGFVFIRWERRKRATSDHHLLIAYLAKSERVDGRPRQRLVYLGSIREQHAMALGATARLYFWDGVLQALKRQNIAGEALDKVIVDIEAKVPSLDEPEASQIIKVLHGMWPSKWSMDDLCDRYRHVLNGVG